MSNSVKTARETFAGLSTMGRSGNIGTRPSGFAGNFFIFGWSVLILLGCSLSTSRAQINLFEDDWRWTTFTVDAGLPSNTVQKIIETPAGTPWVATSEGVAWFDGYEWCPIDSAKGLPHSSSKIEIVPGDEDSVLVIADQTLYIGVRNTVRRTLIDRVSEAIPFENRILVLREQCLFLFDGRNLAPFTADERLTRGKTIDIFRTQAGSVWINTTRGLFRWEKGNWRLRLAAGRERYYVNAIVEDSTETGIASINLPVTLRGLWEWSGNGPLKRSPYEGGDKIRSASIAPDGMILALHSSGDLRIRILSGWNSLTILPTFLKNLSDVLCRRNSDIWLASGHGLFLFRQSSTRWAYRKYFAPDPRDRIHEIVHARNGDLWIATAEGVVVQTPGGSSTSITDIDGEHLYEVTGMAEDTAGGIWISGGFGFNGAYRWDGLHWKFYRIDTLSHPFRIHKIRQDRKGRLWFLGISVNDIDDPAAQPGAYVFENGKFIRWDKRHGLQSDRVYSFAEGSDGALWFASGGGISRWKAGAWTHWDQKNGLKNNRVFTLAIDSAGTVWFGDRVSGLGYILPDDHFGYYSTRDGLVDNRVWDLRIDSNGKLWISTEDGLGSYSHGTWAAFTTRCGLNNPVLWPVLPIGNKVYIGTMGSGVAILNLDERNNPPPRIDIAPPVTENGTAFLRWTPNAFWGELPQQDIPTRFRIDDGPWSQWDTRRNIILNDLSTGTHRFQVQAKGLFGDFDQYGRETRFITTLPFYRSWIFILAMSTLVLAVIVLGLVILRRKQLHDIEIRESEARFRAVTETTSSAIFIFQDGHFLYLNKGTEILTGFPRRELFKMYFWEVVHPDHRDLVRERGLAREQGEQIDPHYEFRIVTKNGDDRWLDYTASRIVYQGRPAVLGTAFDITERKRAEEALRRQELEYRTLLDHVPAMIWFKDAGNTILRLNKAAADSAGKTVEDAEGASVYDLNPDHAEQYHLDDLEVINSGKSKFGIVEPFTHASGEQRWILSDKIPYRAADGRIIGVIVFSQDITERKRTELIQAAIYGIEQAAASTERLDDLFIAVHSILSDVMPAKNFYIALYDEHEDLISFPYFVDEFDPPGPPRKPGHGLTEYVLRTGKSLLCDLELTYELARRGEADVVGTPSPIWLGVPLIVEKKTIGVMALQHYSDPRAFGEPEKQILEFVSSEIAKAIQKKTADDALRESEERYRMLFEESEDTVFISSPEGRLIDINPAGMRLFGFESREELLKADITADLYFHPEDRAQMIAKLTESGYLKEVELMVRRRDGSIRTVLETSKVVRDPGGAIVAYRGILRDITERKQLEQQLMQAQKLESIGTLAGGIAHDFNNILTIILGYASILERKSVDQASFEKNINAIRTASQRGANLVKQLLTFARKTDVLPVPTNINALINELIKLLEATFPKTITFQLDLEQHLPDIVGDQNQIHQAILNLCVNARDAMAGGGHLVLKTRLVAGEQLKSRYAGVGARHYIAVSVEDTGIGMDERTKRRIFEPFFTTKEIGKGTGLGLALVYGVMQSHDGFVDVQSTLGKGTTVLLYIPVPEQKTSTVLSEGTMLPDAPFLVQPKKESADGRTG